MHRQLALLAGLFLLSFGGKLIAHTASESFSRWQFSGDTLTIQFTVSAREAQRLPLGVTLSSYLASHVRVDDSDAHCTSESPFVELPSRQGYVRAELNWQCENQPRALFISAFFDLAAEHTHYASMESDLGHEQALLTREQPGWSLLSGDSESASKSPSLAVFLDFIGLGFKHILGGLDHLVFLLGMLLLCRRTIELLWAVTGFTVGHSLTLTLSALGLVQINVTAIEAVIGLTIALVAVERTANLLRSAFPLAFFCAAAILLLIPLSTEYPQQIGPYGLIGLSLFCFCYLLLSHELAEQGSYRAMITALFGLVHGFGFAGAFLIASLDQATLWLPLAGFNLGVELAQISTILFLLALRRWIGPGLSTGFALRGADTLSAVICGFGVYWFVQRSLFLIG